MDWEECATVAIGVGEGRRLRSNLSTGAGTLTVRLGDSFGNHRKLWLLISRMSRGSDLVHRDLEKLSAMAIGV